MADLRDYMLDHQFGELTTCIDLFEQTLAKQREGIAAKSHDDFRREYVDDLDGESIELLRAFELNRMEESFPRMLRHSMLSAIWTVFDTYLITTTQERIISGASSLEAGKKEAKGIRELGHVKAYWEGKMNVTLPPGWEFIENVREVRNQIVHDRGQRHKVDGINDPVELKRHERTATIDAFIESRRVAGREGLSYSYSNLNVSAGFCEEVATFCCEYLKRFNKVTPWRFNQAEFDRKIDFLCDSGSKGGAAGA